jgi:N-acetylmuramic acid 6-phosphate etherase
MNNLGKLITEARNPASESIDSMSALEIVRLIGAEDAAVAEVVGRQAESIAQAIEAIAARLQSGGRLIYLGAGTSGRLGVLDAAECPPTFNTPPEQVVGIIAGGPAAMIRSAEGAEDRAAAAVEDLQAVGLSAGDAVVGIATSGRTPYVLAGLRYARQQGALCVGLSCNRDALLAALVEISITPVVGPEVISGSTRMKAGTATKMVLNMLSTGAMVLLGKTYGNLMVDLRTTSSKLVDRSRRILMALTKLSEAEAERQLARCDGEVKTAVVSSLRGVGPEDARRLLRRAGGHLRRALEEDRHTPACAPALGAGLPTPPNIAGEAACNLILGIDGGGSKTVACLARPAPAGEPTLLGRGVAGPCNPQAVGLATACENLDQAVAAAFADAKLAPERVAAAVLAVAGSDRDENRAAFTRWAEQRRLGRTVRVVHDALPILAVGSPEGWGVALTAGTGSFAYGISREGRSARAGGWGFLLGDEGSGYAIARAGLRAAARAAEGRGPQSGLLPAFLARLSLEEPLQMIPAIYRIADDRAAVASLATVVFQAAAENDAVAEEILDQAAGGLAEMIAAVARQLDFPAAQFPLALAGGALLGSAELQRRLESRLCTLGLQPKPVAAVTEPVLGALKLARSAVIVPGSG